MRFGLNAGYSGSRMSINMDLVHEADKLGFHSVWAAEAYGSDAVTPVAWIAGQTQKIHVGTAIMQMPARTPAMTAMTATTLDQLSGGRFLLGLGVSGPQVVEGWHGVPSGKPLKSILHGRQIPIYLASIGPKERLRDRLAAWRESGVTTMICGIMQIEAVRALAEIGA